MVWCCCLTISCKYKVVWTLNIKKDGYRDMVKKTERFPDLIADPSVGMPIGKFFLGKRGLSYGRY